ncbi:MAG: zinc-dependent metalloprotease, partial [candidate division KSB1 bacterium]
LWLEIARCNEEFLYQVSLASGVGSNPIGLDRGQLGGEHVVYFERIGPKILLVQPNYKFRALSDDAREREAVRQSFAPSILWGFKIVAEENGKVLVEATDFFLRDAHGVIEQLKNTGQGNFSLSADRSAFYLPHTKSFPENTEIEVTLTFTSSEPGRLVRATIPTPQALTVRQHHSLVKLPAPGYKPREFDPRVGCIELTFSDYASPIAAPLQRRWIHRFRLQKKEPSAAISEAVKPIIYYLDPGVPEPIRSALLEGASWWNQAFEAAGFRNAFRVELLPEGADPMDIRYNVIHWTHRSTRGWSYGGFVSDPRTGEIIKGNVNLGSLRVRQDYLIAAGLVTRYDQQSRMQCEMAALPAMDYLDALATSADPVATSLARLRQLSAHEVGHTIGFAHNFAASTYGRASVMDYPAPLVKINADKLDLSEAYGVGCGAYDVFSVKYAYSDFAPGVEEQAELQKIISAGLAEGLIFLTDQDARPAGAANPLANLWDNGTDMVAELRHEMKVREIGLKTFGPQALPQAAPLALLEEALVPLYLHHRYQLEATMKLIGGMQYSYAVKGEAQTQYEIVAPKQQKEALAAVLETLSPAALVLPEELLRQLLPRPHGYEAHQELFAKRTAPAFDLINMAATAADITVSLLLEPNRAARIVEFNARNAKYFGWHEVLDEIIAATWKAPEGNETRAALKRGVERVVLDRMIDLATNDAASAEVRAITALKLEALAAYLQSSLQYSQSAAKEAHLKMAQRDINRVRNSPERTHERTTPSSAPPGAPIGQEDLE